MEERKPKATAERISQGFMPVKESRLLDQVCCIVVFAVVAGSRTFFGSSHRRINAMSTGSHVEK
jgi:hypothetical protein